MLVDAYVVHHTTLHIIFRTPPDKEPHTILSHLTLRPPQPSTTLQSRPPKQQRGDNHDCMPPSLICREHLRCLLLPVPELLFLVVRSMVRWFSTVGEGSTCFAVSAVGTSATYIDR